MIARHFVFSFLVACATAASLAAADGDRPTPREVLGQLKAGNDRYAKNASRPLVLSVNRRRELAPAERPLAMVLSCADARVPPELVFNMGLGDLFVVRTAGGVVDRSVLASLEYGADRLHVPLLVVMGHDSCDVLSLAAEGKAAAQSPNLDYLVKALQAARRQTSAERDEVRGLVLDNVEQVINDTLAKSPVIRRMVDAGEMEVVGAFYELISGRVVFSDPVAPGVPAPVTATADAGRPSPPAPAAHPASH